MFFLIRQHKIFSAIIAVILAIIGIFVWLGARAKGENGEIVEVQRGSISEEVVVSGTVKPVRAVALGFEQGGTVAQKPIEIGAPVEAGEIIVELVNGKERAALEAARAKHGIEEAKLAELLRGARAEELDIKDTELAQATQALQNRKQDAEVLFDTASRTGDEALHKLTDALFANDDTQIPTLTFSSQNAQAGIDAPWHRILAGAANKNLAKLTVDAGGDPQPRLAQARQNLATIQTFLEAASRALESASNISDTTLATYKTDLNTARKNIDTALDDIERGLQNINNAKLEEERLSRELRLAKSPPTAEEKQQAEAAVAAAAAEVRSAEATLAKTILRSPLRGIVTKQEAEIGELISAHTPIAAVVDLTAFEVEANVPEADIGKLGSGATAQVMLDAYGNKIVLPSHIIRIDPAETIIEGVPTYKTVFSIETKDKRIRPGLSATVAVTIEKRENIIIIPERAVQKENERTYVEVIAENGQITTRDIEIGLRGSNGDVEVVSGLAADEQIRTR